MDVTLSDEFLTFEFPIIKGNSNDVEITRTLDTLRIKYVRSDREDEREQSTKVLKRGIVRKDFDFVWKIPSGFDKDQISSQFENGLLTISIPRSGEGKTEIIKVTNINNNRTEV